MSTRLLSSLSSVLSSPSLPFSLISLFVLLVLVLHLWRRSGGSSRPTLVRGPGVWRLQFGPWLWEEGHLTCFPVRCRLGPLFSMQLGPHFTLVVNSYDLAKEVLLTRGRDFAGRPKMASLSDGDGGIDPRDLLEALLRGQEGQKSEVISDDHVLMTAAETFGAGVETTSTTLLWIIAYMLHHPELEEQVGLERPVRLSDRTRLPYVEAVIQEGLRIRPVSPVLIPHTALTRTSLGGHPVQPGTRVLVNMWALHHNPTDWPQPDLFKPERFLDGRGGRVSPSCFLPFGAGPRVCVGESLARLELFLFLSSLLQRISFSLPPAGPVPDLRGRLGVVLQPPPYLVVATPRHT
uniref:Cytochrome P450, family 17, subfamily A, polypeptide 2 n=1 Tax=Neogobius melanostomus TaxID=47308 RepID=A0A8C6URF1_9GOBI